MAQRILIDNISIELKKIKSWRVKNTPKNTVGANIYIDSIIPHHQPSLKNNWSIKVYTCLHNRTALRFDILHSFMVCGQTSAF